VEEAIALANDSPYGLAAHLWTRDLALAHHTAARLEAGTVFTNCIMLADPAFPFGGMKAPVWAAKTASRRWTPIWNPKAWSWQSRTR
jgi:acyl-CoA reductase-like NAD-dependent aldehyde dehydrogenase